MATIRITDLRLRTIIGINDWERKSKQDVIINVSMEYDASKAAKSDDINDTVDYKALSKEIINKVEDSNFLLLEKLAQTVLDIVMMHSLVKKAHVCVDKPFALRFADSVSVELDSEEMS